MEYRIQEIKVEGLFGMFDHTIPLNQKEHITIVYGENGIGKTMLFRILDCLFRRRFSMLVDLPFLKLCVKFNYGGYLFLDKKEKEIKFTYGTHEEKEAIHKLTLNDELLEKRKSMSTGQFMNFVRQNNFIPDNSEHSGNTHHMFAALADALKNKQNLWLDGLDIETPEILIKLFNSVKTHFIHTQRLFVQRTPDYFGLEDKSSNPMIEAVLEYSKEISNIIRNTYTQYNKLSEELELSLGKRLLGKQVKTNYTYDELVKEAEAVRKRRAELKSVGLLDGQSNDDFAFDEKMDDLSKAVISVNIQDIKRKLEIYDDLYIKLNLFTEILNERRFSYKKISISEYKGFIFKNDNGDELTADQLSSGEQHELILLYQLLFKVPNNALILLDEPEISLHIAWQKEFLKDMQDIIKLRNFDIVLATHSPSIINGNWDMTVSLTGKELVAH